MTFKPMPLLTGLSLVSLVILVLLGNWQYARYSEKIAKPVEAAQEDVPGIYAVEIDRAHPGNLQNVYGFANSEPIWRRYAPGKLVDTGEAVLVMVEATGGPEPVPMSVGTLPERVTFEGILAAKVANESVFNAQDNPEADQWYRLDPAGMSARLDIAPVPKVLEPITMTVRNAADLDQARQTPNPYAYSKPLDPLPPERHFGYALTWWGMALGLIGVYLALHRARGRLKF